MTEYRPNSSVPRDLRSPNASGPSRLSRWATWTSRVGAWACGLLMAGIVGTTFWGFSLHAAGTGGLEFAATFFIGLPLGSIAPGLVCLAGALLCLLDWRRTGNPQAGRGLRVCLIGPLALVACYGICYAAMYGVGV